MSDKTIRPGLTAAMRVGRELLAAGWRYDSTTPMAGDTTERAMLHPSGREISARTTRDGDSTDLTMTGLSLEQVAGAVAGAGLGAPAAAAEPVDDRAKLIAGLRALVDFYENNPTMPVPAYPYLLVGKPRGGDETDEEGVARVRLAADILGVEAVIDDGNAHVERMFGGLKVRVYAHTKASMDAYKAMTSYSGSVQPDRSAS